MHPDLAALLELQSKDLALMEVDGRLEALDRELAALDQALARARESAAAARRAAQDAARRRDELEAKIQSYRTIQERRRQRLDHTRNAKEAAALMAELDLARSVLAKEESEWFRLADGVASLEAQAVEAERQAEEFA
ncbi:MAG TPA: hypothetical protein VNK43_10795, partial [Gemmatimonadales bacterium]|nr:hypothetical protein [Gemmatimonadales bacterium]